MHDPLAVIATTPNKRDEARQLAHQYQLAYIQSNEANLYRYLLVIDSNYIGLQDTAKKKFLPFKIDFLSKQFLYRIKHASFKSELIGKAMGIKPRHHPFIVDATAGLGRDSFILAVLGYRVVMLERSPIVYLLLKDALKRGEQSLKPIIEHLTLYHTDSIAWLTSNHTQPEIIYLDPMFPKREKSASVKKEMIILQNLLTNDDNMNDLFKLALTCASHRVVVKRPRLAANMMDVPPSFSLTGKNSRFDIYLV